MCIYVGNIVPAHCWSSVQDCRLRPYVTVDCRIQRDVAMRGRDIAGVIEQYTNFVKPAFDTFVAPSRKHADVIIPWGRCAAYPFLQQIHL